MALCVAVEAGGAVVASTADPCTTAVLLTPAEYAHLANSPWHLTMEQGALVAVAVASVWIVGFAARTAIKALRSDETGNE